MDIVHKLKSRTPALPHSSHGKYVLNMAKTPTISSRDKFCSDSDSKVLQLSTDHHFLWEQVPGAQTTLRKLCSSRPGTR